MIKVGNEEYETGADLPESVPVIPLAGALLLPGTQLPLNIFEPRYVRMIDESLIGDRIIGVIQPASSGAGKLQEAGVVPDLCAVGCLGRITSFSETGDGRYMITLGGICRFRVTGEIEQEDSLFRRCSFDPSIDDLNCCDSGAEVDREGFLANFRAYLDANNLEVDWSSIEEASNALLVNSLSMLAPYGPVEKQALLEAADIRERADTLVAFTEILLGQSGDDKKWRLQ